MTRRAVFLDKDGTLIEDVPYNVDPARVTLASGAGSALRELKLHGYSLIVVSNQAGVALGRFPLQALAAVERRIQELLRPCGVAIDAFYYCPHLPQAPNVRFDVQCLCRKPQPGLLRRAARDWNIELGMSWLVGDILDDVEAGNRAGCRTVFVDVGNETEWRLGMHRQPHLLARSLGHAVSQILAPVARGPHGAKDDGDATDVASGA
jgi:histidinol-phosphate phosphatase family protein